MTLPTTITVQDKLLTIDTNTAPILKDVILPGIQVQPLYLNAEEGNLVGIMDAGWIADAVNTAAAEQGFGKAHYIRGNNSGYSD